jgi:hypothetical protein
MAKCDWNVIKLNSNHNLWGWKRIRFLFMNVKIIFLCKYFKRDIYTQHLKEFVFKGKKMVCKLMNPYMVQNNLFMYEITRLMHISCLRNLKKVMWITICISRQFTETFLWSLLCMFMTSFWSLIIWLCYPKK